MSGILFGSEPADAKGPAGHQCQRQAREAQQHAHVDLGSQLARRNERRRKKESDAEADGRNETDRDAGPATRRDAAGAGRRRRRARRRRGCRRACPPGRPQATPRCPPPTRRTARRHSRARRRTAPPAPDSARRSRTGSACRATPEKRPRRSPGSRAACGRKGMIGNSASAGCRPLQYRPIHESAPGPATYGQNDFTRARRRPLATLIAVASTSTPPARCRSRVGLNRPMATNPAASQVIASRITNGIAGWCLPKISRAVKYPSARSEPNVTGQAEASIGSSRGATRYV